MITDQQLNDVMAKMSAAKNPDHLYITPRAYSLLRPFRLMVKLAQLALGDKL